MHKNTHCDMRMRCSHPMYAPLCPRGLYATMSIDSTTIPRRMHRLRTPKVCTVLGLRILSDDNSYNGQGCSHDCRRCSHRFIDAAAAVGRPEPVAVVVAAAIESASQRLRRPASIHRAAADAADRLVAAATIAAASVLRRHAGADPFDS